MAHLVLSQRYEIYYSQKQGVSCTDMAKSISVHKLTIPRELRRNSDNRNGIYKVVLAQKKSEGRQFNKLKYIGFTKEIKGFVIFG